MNKTRKPYATCAYNFSLKNRDSDIRLDKKVADCGITELTSVAEIQCTFRDIENENDDCNHSASKRLCVGSSALFCYNEDLSVHTLGTVSSFSDNRRLIAVDGYEFEPERNSEKGLLAYSQFPSIQS